MLTTLVAIVALRAVDAAASSCAKGMSTAFWPSGIPFDGPEHHVSLPMTITDPGEIRVACPKGMLGTIVLGCESQEPATSGPELHAISHDCEEIHQDVCESFGTACGMCGKDEPPDGRAGYCDLVQRQGMCARPKYRAMCQETCCFE